MTHFAARGLSRSVGGRALFEGLDIVLEKTLAIAWSCSCPCSGSSWNRCLPPGIRGWGRICLFMVVLAARAAAARPSRRFPGIVRSSLLALVVGAGGTAVLLATRAVFDETGRLRPERITKT